jgi:GcrA cell cycle regulator
MSTALKKKAAQPKRLLDLGPNDCRWPIGEPRSPDFRFCGKPHTPGRPYCDHHWEMAFQPPRPRNHGSRQQAQALVIVPPPAAKAA